MTKPDEATKPTSKSEEKNAFEFDFHFDDSGYTTPTIKKVKPREDEVKGCGCRCGRVDGSGGGTM